jgi:uncharacterized protein YjbI with pentapeptide repeats
MIIINASLRSSLIALVYAMVFWNGQPTLAQPIKSDPECSVVLHAMSSCTVDARKRIFLQKPSITSQFQLDQELNSPHSSNEFVGAAITNCSLQGRPVPPDITLVTFTQVNAAGVDFSKVSSADCTKFNQTDLEKANFAGRSLVGAEFSGNLSKLKHADFSSTNLTGAKFIEDVDLSGANFSASDLSNVSFEPHNVPDALFLGEAVGLETLRYVHDSSALFVVRKTFADIGLADKARDVTYAIMRSSQIRLRAQCTTGFEDGKAPFRDHKLGHRTNACILYSIRAVAFDATCQFGRRPWRPLGIMAALCLLWTLALTIWFLTARPLRLDIAYFSGSSDDPKRISATKLLTRTYSSGSRMLAYSRLALSIAIGTIFNLPFKDVEVGKWLQMLSSREVTYKAKGHLRTFLGVLSLCSFYLLALWVLVYFGNPFAS